MALRLKLRPKPLPPPRSTSYSSSSSSSSPPDSNADGEPTEPAAPPPPPPPPSYSSYFSDIKDRLKSPPQPPRRIPSNPPPPSLSSSGSAPATSLEEIRKHLAGFRLNPSSSPPPTRPPSSAPPISFQELFKNKVLSESRGGGADDKQEGLSFDSIRESLRQFRASPAADQRRPSQPSFSLRAFRDSLKDQGTAPPILGGDSDRLPDSIFGKELRERKEEEGEGAKKGPKTEFVKLYSYDELGEKLRRLRPDEAKKGGNEWFSLNELNERLAKLREMEERETESRMGGVSFRDLRESLVRLKEADANKKADMRRWSIITNLGGQMTPTFMLKPPQEHLLENYFHPDHMSSGEKMKLELKRVRDEFKMSQSDCGSARVQVAQLTTKIKHLSQVLHKKDKHSKKGLQEMVQRRKKLLKYLRRTDWDSYCMVLSKLGLRDVPVYKTPNYKT